VKKKKKKEHTRQNLSLAFVQFGSIKFVDIRSSEIYLRFSTAPEANKLLNEFKNENEIFGKDFQMVLLSGEEEKKYFEDNIKTKAHNGGRKFRNGGKKGGRKERGKKNH